MSIKFPYFTLAFSIFTVIAFSKPLLVLLNTAGYSPLFIVMTFLAVTAVLNIIYLLILAGRAAKPVAIALTIINSGVFYFMETYNVMFDKVMIMNLMQTEINETLDLLSYKLLLYIITLGIIPSIIVCKINIIETSYKQKLKSILASGLILALITLIPYQNTKMLFKNNPEVKFVLVPYNYFSGLVSFIKLKAKRHSKIIKIGEDAELQPYWNNSKKNLFVLVIGESARAANFSLNGYERPTNAALNPYKKDLVYFSNFSSCGTATAVSLQCMLSKDPRQKFKVNSGDYTENLLDVAKRAGYKVLWRENNTDCKNVCNRIEIEDFCSTKECFDEILLKDFQPKVLSNNDNQLIVMHQKGSHGPLYHNRYPDEFEIYKPVCKSTDLTQCSQEELINTYDNTILYTSYVLKKQIEELNKLKKEYNVALLYVSDHGESLGENNVYLHSSPYNIAPQYQTRIPAFIWIPEEGWSALNINKKCLSEKVSDSLSHDNIFHSFLGLLGIKTKQYEQKLDFSASCRKK